MPVERPRKLGEVYPYLSQQFKANSWRIFESVPSVFLGLGAFYGVLIWATNGYGEVTEIFGFPIYTLYPGSMIIFGTFGAILCLREKYKGLLAVMSAAAIFDLIGIFTAGEKPANWLWVAHMSIILLAFVANQKSIFKFVWSAPFMFFVIVALTGSPWIYWIQVPYAEPCEELIWCCCFYQAFYGFPKKKVSDRHEIQIADITYHP